MMTANEHAWMEMTLAAMRRNQPRRFIGDFLAHDRSQLGLPIDHARLTEVLGYPIPENHPQPLPEGTPFGWVLRDSGTELICPADHYPNMAAQCAAILEFYSRGNRHDNPHFFVWTGDRLRLIEVSLEDLSRWTTTGQLPEPTCLATAGI